MEFALGWICTGVVVIGITQIKTYFVLKDILKELKNHIKE